MKKNTVYKEGLINYLEMVDFLMDEYGMGGEAACRMADFEFNKNYSADDYDC